MARRKSKGSKQRKPASTQPRRQRPNSKPKPKPASQSCALSKVAAAYADALARPDVGPLVGIPNGDTIFSKKIRVFSRGTAAAGANGNLHILCQPFAALANDLNVLAVVGNLTALPDNTPTLCMSAGGVTSNSPYASADFAATTGVQGRLVSAKLRIKFIGTALNAGGVHHGIQEPTHGSLHAKTEVDFLKTTCSHMRSITHGEDWFEITYRPVDKHDTSWIDTITRTSASEWTAKSDGVGMAYAQYPFMATITKCPAASQNILYEFWAVIEVAGPTVTGKTITPPDVQGWATVMAAHSQFDENHGSTTTRQASQESQFASSTIQSYAGQLLSAAVPYVTPYVQRGAQMLAAAAVNRYLPRQPRRLTNLLR